jgi:UrcA family protein
MKFLVMVAAVAVSGVLLVPTLAHARQVDSIEQVSATVRYNPADLRTQDGADRFQKKVDSAIKIMCARGRENVPSLIADTRRCIDGAREAAQSRVQLVLADAQ